MGTEQGKSGVGGGGATYTRTQPITRKHTIDGGWGEWIGGKKNVWNPIKCRRCKCNRQGWKTTHPGMYKRETERLKKGDKDRIMKRKQVRLATHVVSRYEYGRNKYHNNQHTNTTCNISSFTQQLQILVYFSDGRLVTLVQYIQHKGTKWCGKYKGIDRSTCQHNCNVNRKWCF